MTAAVSPADFPPIRWHAHWIWAGDAQIIPGSPFGWDTAPRPEAHGLFRKSLTLTAVPPRVPARISADSRYRLFVNGVEVGYGPPRSQPRRLRYDMYDLTPYLQAGENVIAVLVKYHGQPRTDWIPAVGNGTLGKTGVLVFEADLGPVGWVVSDDSWKARLGRGWSEDGRDPGGMAITLGIPVESFDARAEPADWNRASHDDGQWPNAQKIIPIHIGGRGRSQPPTDPYGAMLPRSFAPFGGPQHVPVDVASLAVPPLAPFTSPSPAVRVEGVARPVQQEMIPCALPLTVTGPALIRLDFGRIVAGFVDIDLDAPSGSVVECYYSEEPLARPPEFGAVGGNRYVARGKDDQHRVFDKKGFRYAHLLIHSANGPVTLTAFSVQEHVYPWTGSADFSCSDADLNRLYAAARRTVALNSWDGFTDCPTREQRTWVGDAVVHQMVHLSTNADWRLASHFLDLGNSPRPDGILPMSVAGDVEGGGGFTIPDWSLHWVHGVHNLYRYQGDKVQIKEYLPTAERILRWYLPYLGPLGVLQDVAEWNLIDWSALYSEGQSAIVTALWARGLDEFAQMADWLGEAASANWARGLWQRVQAGFDLFWDDARGVYVDYAIDGAPQRPVNQIACALAIVSGLAPQDRHARIVAAITDPARLVVRSWMFPGQDATPQERGARFRRMVTGGLVPDWDIETQIVLAEPFMSYVVHDAVAQAGRADLLPGLLHRWLEFLTDGYDTLGENWGTGTRVHGWSSCPARDLAAYVLGVTPAKPGFALARIAPRLGPLTQMAGRVPTPFGEIAVSVRSGTLRVDSPVPVVIDLGHSLRTLPAGAHVLTL